MDACNEIVVRSVRPEDAQAIANVHGRTWRVGYTDLLTAEQIELTVPQRCSVERWERIVVSLRFEQDTLLLAEREECVIGFVQFGGSKERPNWGEIHRIYVVPEEWGRGAAQLLMDAALAAFAARGDAGVVLWTPATPRSRRFYERNGFEPTGATRTLADGLGVTDKEYVFSPPASP